MRLLHVAEVLFSSFGGFMFRYYLVMIVSLDTKCWQNSTDRSTNDQIDSTSKQKACYRLLQASNCFQNEDSTTAMMLVLMSRKTHLMQHCKILCPKAAAFSGACCWRRLNLILRALVRLTLNLFSVSTRHKMREIKNHSVQHGPRARRDKSIAYQHFCRTL